MHSRPIDHIVIAVQDLNQACQHYRTLGFTISPGGIHEQGYSHNALIHLADGSFLELFAFRPGWRRMFLRLWNKWGMLDSKKQKLENGFLNRFLKGLYGREGMIDFAIKVEDFTQQTATLREEGLSLSADCPFSRLKPDGSRVSWELAFPEDLLLPFLMSGYDPPKQLPEAATTHANGVKGIYGLSIASATFDTHFQLFQQLLAADPQIGRREGAPMATFDLGHQWVRLLEKNPDQEAGLVELQLHGEQEIGPLELSKTHQARIHILARG
ncbi:MAG: VOC family protein [Bacteroidota bacterium]